MYSKCQILVESNTSDQHEKVTNINNLNFLLTIK